MVFITHVRLGGGNGHEHITNVKWSQPSHNKSGTWTTAEAVAWIDKGNKLYVTDGKNQVEVGVVRPAGHAAYLRTYADGKWTDNLLALPRF